MAFSCTHGVVLDEAADPVPASAEAWAEVPAGLHGAIVSTDEVYLKGEVPALPLDAPKEIALSGWKGEMVSAQIVLWSADDVRRVKVVSDCGWVSPYFVRYTLTDEFGNACRCHDPKDFPPHLYPDALDPEPCVRMAARSTRCVWLSIDIPSDAEAGEHVIGVKVASSKGNATYKVKLTVVDRVLPPASEWSYYIDLWQHPAAVARVHGCEVWSDEHFEWLEKYARVWASCGQKAITCTLNKDPWNHQCYDAYEDMIRWSLCDDGSWKYDYAVFDRWVTLMENAGVTKEISCYSLLPWNNELHYYDEVKMATVDVQANPGTPAFEELWKPFLADFADHLRAKGWLSKTAIAMDERSPEQMSLALALLSEASPEFRVNLADNHRSYDRYPDISNISVSVKAKVEPEILAARREKGYVTCFYVCCGDRFPNMFTFSDPMEAVYAAWYAVSNGYDGMLRWAFNSWPADPLRDSRYTSFPAGDTFMIYPGPMSSIRFEKLKEGIQDAEKLRILGSDLASPFSTRKPEAGWQSALKEARKQLNK